jgi:hypothetical protein
MAGLPDDLRVSIASTKLRKAIRAIAADERSESDASLQERADHGQDLIGAEVMLGVAASSRKERRGRGH